MVIRRFLRRSVDSVLNLLQGTEQPGTPRQKKVPRICSSPTRNHQRIMLSPVKLEVSLSNFAADSSTVVQPAA